jgi:DNA repair protein RecN (Recombination protein N)
MLRELAVQNLALIEDVRIELEPGFCAWTGETGAGKTLLLQALDLLLGGRGSSELIRRDAEELRVSGRFELCDVQLLAELETKFNVLPEEGQLIVTRRLTRAGRSYAYLNEQPVSVGALRQLGPLLVDIHGQHESQSLLERAYQLRLLDAFGGLEEQREAYSRLVHEIQSVRRNHAALLAEQQQRQRELALLRFEREELDQADLRAGEMAELARDRDRLLHAQNLRAFAETAWARLHDEEGSVVEQIGKLLREAEGWQSVEPDLQPIVVRLQSTLDELQDLAGTLRNMAPAWEADPERLETVDQRLQMLRRLEGKYRQSIEALVSYRAELDRREPELEHQEEQLQRLAAEIAERFDQLKRAGQKLGKGRRKVAIRLAQAIQVELAELGMADARISVNLEPVALGSDPLTDPLPAGGLEEAEFYLAANPGEPARPLRKVASGGELSRTMLALKTVLAQHYRVGTLIFDEIDANVGGRLGDAVGRKLAALGRSRQVICVTHLPQVACYASHQWSIRKTQKSKRSVTVIQSLAGEQRVEELASMLRGQSKSETTRKEAGAMLAAAKRHW